MTGSAGGPLGGLLAGFGFMLPGFLPMLATAHLYSRIAMDLTSLGALFLGMSAAIGKAAAGTSAPQFSFRLPIQSRP